MGQSPCVVSEVALRPSSPGIVLFLDDHPAAVTEQPLVGGNANFGVLHLAISRLASQLPGQFTDLGDNLAGRFHDTTAPREHGILATQGAALCQI